MAEIFIISEKINEELNRVNKYLRIEINKLIKKINLTFDNIS